MHQQIAYRFYEPGDEEAINELFRRVYSRKRSIEEWSWKFFSLPISEPIIGLAFTSDDHLVGHYSIIPFKFNFMNNDIIAWQIVDIMVDERYRGRDIFQNLVKMVTRQSLKRGAKFHYGYPNRVSLPIGKAKFGWETVFEIPIFCKYLGFDYLNKKNIPIVGGLFDRFYLRPGLKKCQSVLNQSSYRLQRIDDFSGLAGSDLFEQLRENSPICTVRNAEFLEQRYMKHPHKEYISLAASTDEESMGYVILGEGEEDKGALYIADIFSIDRPCMQSMLAQVILYAYEKGYGALKCWGAPGALGKKLEYFAQAFGFVKRHSGIVQEVFLLNTLSDKERKYLLNPANWYITRGDSDTI